ncbi:MAG TPA: NAD(P)H-hydrate dehydratase [Lentimicrobium sp.]|nr:NAD(P)H-hydrate dehydratase [Lentimicrobium sp.]
MCAMKILPVEKIREADAYTIAHEPVSSTALMERAASACFRWILKKVPDTRRVRVVCGMGNNGGDGLVIARLLHNAGYSTDVFIVRHAGEPTADFALNFNLLADLPGLVITDVFEADPLIEIDEDDVVVDAILGSGLTRPVTGWMADVIDQINHSGAMVISIDIPSGLFADKAVNLKHPEIVMADFTLTFQMTKLAFLVPENERFCGNWKVLGIGLHPEFIEQCECNNYLIETDDCRSLYKVRPKFAHKGHFGHALLIAGSTGKSGAAVMAARACLRSGVGLLTVHTPADGFQTIQGSVHEAMVSIDPDDSCFSALPVLDAYNAIGIGPGLGMDEQSAAALKLLIQQTHVPLVLDADALNILGENKTWLSFLPPGSILTPHPKEFERLTEPTGNHFDRLELLRAFAVRYRLYIVLKGAYTATATPEGDLFYNPTGNPGMATGGSGDVLTGIILGLRASGYSARDACILGVWLHGKAGDLAAGKYGQPSMLPGDMIEMLGKAFKKIS